MRLVHDGNLPTEDRHCAVSVRMTAAQASGMLWRKHPTTEQFDPGFGAEKGIAGDQKAK